MYGAPEDDSYGVDFAAETLNQAYPGCTGLYLDVAGHMVAFYGRKGHSKAGLLHEQGIQASQAIASIPTWMGCPATWRVKCVSVAEANEIVTACKRLERENWRRARWELQHRFLRHATGFLTIGSHQTIPASGNLEFDVSGWSTSWSGRSCRP